MIVTSKGNIISAYLRQLQMYMFYLFNCESFKSDSSYSERKKKVVIANEAKQSIHRRLLRAIALEMTRACILIYYVYYTIDLAKKEQ